MNIRRSRIIRALAVSIGPFVISIGQFIQLQNMIYYPIITLLIAISLFAVFFYKTPEYYVKQKENGFLLAGSQKGLYDPDYIEFSAISDIEKRGTNIILTMSNNETIELYIPSKYREPFITWVTNNISK